MTNAPLVIPIVVPKLSVHVVTGETCYRHENGFSGIFAEVIADDPHLVKRLSFAQKYSQIITLRCAMLDVTGKITKSHPQDGSEVFILSVDDLAYRKPGCTTADA